MIFVVFFFIKQKTAYEMRISDWSSDVCSSDLGTLVTKGIEVYNGKVIFYSLGKFLMKGPRPTGDVPIGVNAAVGKDTRKGLADMEIGRASCRERVCQDV